MIPKIINFVWTGDNKLPEWAGRNITEFKILNPNYKIVVHGQEVLLDELKEKYTLITDITSKSDLLRLSALKRFGGWYFDCDFWPFRPLSEIENAYGLTGERLFVSKQNGQKNSRLTFTNSVLAASANCETIDKLIDFIIKAEPPFSRVSFGPQMITDFMMKQPSLFSAADWPWFFPCNIKTAFINYCRILSGYSEVVYTLAAETGGQRPFAMHLWAGGKADFENSYKTAAEYPAGPESGKLAGILVNDVQAKNIKENPDHPLRAIAEGLAKIGYRVEARIASGWPLWYEKPEVIFAWNGKREDFEKIIAKARSEGIKTFVSEHGFFDRSKYFQVDKKGILHWSSWASEDFKSQISPMKNSQGNNLEITDESKNRFERVWPAGITPIRSKKNGYILVLGQVTGDTQLYDSEIQGALQLDKAVCRAINDLKIEAYFRPHPKDKSYFYRNKYLKDCPASTLTEAIAGAKFAITINSNSGVECLALGLPVLCFGPATYEQAGVAKKTSAANLRKDIIEMMDCPQLPEQERVNNYLYRLAGKQWSIDELKAGNVLEKLIESA